MSNISVAEAAERLGVNVQRVHQRIADGSLRAARIGSQWVFDEESVIVVSGSRDPGRPLSARSAWALVALADGRSLHALAPSERARASARLSRLLSVQPSRRDAN